MSSHWKKYFSVSKIMGRKRVLESETETDSDPESVLKLDADVELEFLEDVAKYPILYDRKHGEYKNCRKKGDYFSRIGNYYDINGFKLFKTLCRRRKTALKQIEQKSKSGSGTYDENEISYFHLVDGMSFLDGTNKKRDTRDNLQLSMISEETEPPNVEEIQQFQKKQPTGVRQQGMSRNHTILHNSLSVHSKSRARLP